MSTDPAPAEALIIVDMQRGFLEGPKAIPDAAPLVNQMSRLLSRAREANALVVHLQNDGTPGAEDEPGTPGWELALVAAESEHEAVIRKAADDGFTGTGLGDLLDRHGVRRVIVGGLLSEMCVSATARTALARGLTVVVPRDAHGTYDLDDIPAAVVARVAEHALGDQLEVVDSTAVSFVAPPM